MTLIIVDGVVHKVCSTCKESKPIAEFALRRKSKDGHRGQCRQCTNAAQRERDPSSKRRANRAHYWRNVEESRRRAADWNRANPRKVLDMHLRRTFGISVDDFDRMVEEQEGLCAACHQAETANIAHSDKQRRLHVDHDHATGRVRGLLCTRCNVALGYVLDDPQRLRFLLNYLLSHG